MIFFIALNINDNNMKILKYLLYVLGGIMALNSIGGLIMGRVIPVLWMIMIMFFIGGAVIKVEK